ncbi:methyltransferase domain-containing protein [Nonomuraea sp. NPDC047897]|uniref:methyltransferase domain-containing protein n=1 Tax=Nonomuraea sp. NPDC047897 TaxID=3364346 RepID=UPI0037235CBF
MIDTRAPDPIGYLDQVAASAPGQGCKRRVLRLLDLRPGHTVVDIGCGPGTDLGAMAAAVAPGGTVVGVDRDPVMVETAGARLAGTPGVRVRHGDAHALPLADGIADRARTDRVLQHVDDPARALAEVRRMLRPGGHAVLAEPDWDGLLIDSGEPELSRRLARFVATEIVRNATVGRSLARLCAGAGLAVRSVEVYTPVFRDFGTADRLLGLRRSVGRAIRAGHLDAGAEEWIAEVAARPFLATFVMFLVTAEVA